MLNYISQQVIHMWEQISLLVILVFIYFLYMGIASKMGK